MTADRLPAWAVAFAAARRDMTRAERAAAEALERRCDVRESGGYRCTADIEPDHRHRYDRTALPGGLQ